MPQVPFASLPDTARLWIFAAAEPLAAPARDRLLGAVDAFLDQWQAHGAPLIVARDWRHDRFLFVGVDESAAGASGCSIDAMVRVLAGLEADLGVSLLDHGPVLYRDQDRIARASRPAFAALARAGSVTPETVVFDNTIATVGELRAGRWEGPARAAWHARAFFAGAPA